MENSEGCGIQKSTEEAEEIDEADTDCCPWHTW